MSPLMLRVTPFCSYAQVVTVVTVAGAVDHLSAPQLRSRLDTVPDRGTVVDLAGVTLLATAGLTVLLDLRHRLHRSAAQLVLLGVPPHIRRLIVVSGLDTALPMTPVVTEAVELVAGPPSPGSRPATDLSRSASPPAR